MPILNKSCCLSYYMCHEELSGTSVNSPVHVKKTETRNHDIQNDKSVLKCYEICGKCSLRAASETVLHVISSFPFLYPHLLLSYTGNRFRSLERALLSLKRLSPSPLRYLTDLHKTSHISVSAELTDTWEKEFRPTKLRKYNTAFRFPRLS